MGGWLIISYFANINGMASSHHIDDRIPYLRQKRIDVHLLSSPCGPRNRDVLHTRVPSLAPSGIRFELRHFLKRKTKRKLWYKFLSTALIIPILPLYLLEKILQRVSFKMDSTWSWFFSGSLAGLYIYLREKPSVIYSTGGSISAHLAALTISRLTGVAWIAEFQDPLVYQSPAVTKNEGRFIQWVERVVCKRAEKVVFLTNAAKNYAQNRTGVSRKLAAIYPGAVADCFPAAGKGTADGTFSISHIGSLGGTRDLEYFLKGLELLLKESPDLVRLIRLKLYGHTEKNARRPIDGFRYRDIIEPFGKVSRAEALRGMTESSVLLLIQNRDGVSSETIPSKVYEYLRSGRPILALVYRNPELQGMIEEMGHIAVQADDAAAIRDGLKVFFERWKNAQLEGSVLTSPYTVEKAVDSLISLSRDIAR